MNEEEYEKLNNYLNDIFLKLEKIDEIFIENLSDIVKLNTIINKSFDEKIISSYKENNMSFEDVYILTREIIEKINPNYLKDYDNLITSGQLNFDYENNERSYFLSQNKHNQVIKTINLSRKFNYDDVEILVHEFIHFTHTNDSRSYNCEFLTEFLAIYFELIAQKYLLNEKDVPKEEICLNSRIIDFLRWNNDFYKYSIILLAYEQLGNINKNTKEDLKLLNFKDDHFDEECEEFLKELESCKNLDEQLNLVNQDYRYIVGTILAYYALEHSNINNIIKLNDNINSEYYAYMPIQEVLETIGISINNDTINESINIIKNSIYKEKTK